MQERINKNIMNTEENITQWFERLWIAYDRKGAKKVAKAQWDRLTDKEREMAERHIPYYVSSRESRVFCKDFERYLRDHVFENPVYDKKGNLVFDPDATPETEETTALEGFQG